MWQAYWQTVSNSPWDKFILFAGLLLVLAHLVVAGGHYHGTKTIFVQGLGRCRSVLLLFIELFPIMGLLGTVFGLMFTFANLKISSDGNGASMETMISSFAPAMSTTISGLLVVMINLPLNAFLFLLTPDPGRNGTDDGAAE